MTCREAIREVFKSKDEVLTTADVKQRVNAAHPGRWKDTAISADLIGSSVNAPSSRWYPAARRAAQLRSAEELLGTLRKRLEGPIAPELKRRIVEALVEKIQADTTERWGVPQSELTIFYRFSQPGEAAALVLPRSIRLNSKTRLTENLETIGDHLLRRRLALKLLQRQVATQLGVNVASLRNWEANRSKPTVEFMPAIIRFLGYNPLPPGTTRAERLVSCRTAMGVTQGEAARRIGVDQSTLAKWERGEREPAGLFAVRAKRFLAAAESASTATIA